MIATIVCGLVIIVCIVILILNFTDVIYYTNDVVMKLLLFVSSLILSISLIYGYAYNSSELEKKTIIYLLETNLNEYSVDLAERYNRAEHFGNNYWCRFTLREENLIDINSYLYNDKEAE